MKFTILSIVKNEADIIESFVRHNLQFADELFILDNGSDDHTFLILQKLQEEGLPIHLSQDATLGHQQQQLAAGLLASAQAQSDADMFMLLDADEFLCIHPDAPVYGQPSSYHHFFHAYLEQVKQQGVAALHWLNFLPADTEKSSDYINHFNEFLECTHPPIAHQKALYSREMLGRTQIVAGNHHLNDKQTGERIEQTVSKDIAIAHFPIRSKEQAVAKVLTNAISLNSRSLAEGESFHIFQMQQEIVSNNYQISMEKCREIAQSYGIPPFYSEGVKLGSGKLNPTPIEHRYLHLNNVNLVRSLNAIAMHFSKNTLILKETISDLENKNSNLGDEVSSLEEKNVSLEDKNSNLEGKVSILEDKISDFEYKEQDLQSRITQLTQEYDKKTQNINNLHQHQAYLTNDLQESRYRFTKYKKLWVVRLIKPLIQMELAISSANRYRKLFRKLIKEKGSIGKAYQICRRTYKASGMREVKTLLRQQNLDLREIEALAIENAKDGLVILATKHTHYIAKLFDHALKKVNIESTIILETPKGGYSNKLHIVICPQMFETLPDHYLAFQMEQSVSSRWFTDQYFQRLDRAAHIFDYSITNIAFLQEHQIPFKQLHYMPIGLLPSLNPSPTQDFEYDVAFYGDPNCERRKLFLEKLREKFSVKVISEVFGDELHALLKKAKIVVNIHYYENALLETTRIYECLSLNKLVVSEQGSDQDEHTELNGIVDFVKIGDVDAMIDRIGYWLDKPEHFEIRLQAIYDFQQQPDKFQFYLYRFLLSQDLIDFETFYRLSGDYVKPQGDFWCLSLPESVARRQDFDRDNRYGISVFPGLRHNIGWIGCGLSYKFMMRVAEDLRLPRITICEDDVSFCKAFEQRYSRIQQTLAATNEPWDVYSGLIADLSEKTEIYPSTIHSDHEKFYGINRLVSMVFNTYNQSAYSKIYSWDENDRLFHNTIDRYIELHGGIQGVITSPFLVGHKEDLVSTLWGQQNTMYKDMIIKSQSLLDQKIAELQDKS